MSISHRILTGAVLLAAAGGCSHTYYQSFHVTTDPSTGVSITRKSTGAYLGKGPRMIPFFGDGKCWYETLIAEKSGYETRSKKIEICPQYEDQHDAESSPTEVRIVLQPETRIRQRVVRERPVEEEEPEDQN